MSGSSRSRAAAAVVAMLIAVTAACARNGSGDGFRLSADQLQPQASLPQTDGSSTTTTAPVPQAGPSTLPPPDQAQSGFPATVAAAKGATLEVFASKPTPEQAAAAGGQPAVATDAPVLQPVALGVAGADSVAPIPRPGLPTEPYKAKTLYGWSFGNPTSFGNTLDLLVTQNDGDWLKVLLPVRPNGTEGWVRASDVNLSSHSFRMQLKLGDFTLTAWDGGRVIAQTKVVVGKPSSPTPTGRFYVNEKVKGDGGAYGPWILSTNGYSEALEEFDGGLPVIAFHGTNQPNLIGSRASNGCVRMPNDVVSKLASTLPPGTPVDIIP